MPVNLTLVPLPPYSPELNPVERVWEYLRDRWLSHRWLSHRWLSHRWLSHRWLSHRWLSHRVLAGGYAAVPKAARAAWNALLAEPGRLRSLTSYPWLPASVTSS